MQISKITARQTRYRVSVARRRHRYQVMKWLEPLRKRVEQKSEIRIDSSKISSETQQTSNTLNTGVHTNTGVSFDTLKSAPPIRYTLGREVLGKAVW